MKLVELRRNPELNPKQNGHRYAVDFLEDLGDLTNYGVSMTKLPKLGINPQSTHSSTPIGVYFYPAIYYINTINRSKVLPYGRLANYIQVFKFGGNVLDLSKVSEAAFDDHCNLLYRNINKIANVLNITEADAEEWLTFKISVVPGSDYAYKLWKLIAIVGHSPYTGDERQAPRSSVLANYLLRLIGIDVAIDRGEGIIHPNEPIQGVVLNPQVIKHVKTIDNK